MKNTRLGQGITRPLLEFSRFVQSHAGNLGTNSPHRIPPRTAQVKRGLSTQTQSARYRAPTSHDPWQPLSFAVHWWASSMIAALTIALEILSST